MNQQTQERTTGIGPMVPAQCEPGQPARVLAFDLGHCTGWACLESPGDGTVLHVDSGLIRTTAKARHPGARFQDWESRVLALLGNLEPTAVGFEDVKSHAGTQAAHVYGGYKRQLIVVCASVDAAVLAFGVGRVKKRLTGNGHASKEAMIGACLERFGFLPQDDNHADALAVALCALDDAVGYTPSPPTQSRR